jgi:hypothetical protein
LTNKHIQALFVLSFPIVLSIGIILIPVIPDYSDHRLASEAVNSTGRWFAGHMISAVAFGLSLLSVTVISANLKNHYYKLPLFLLPIMSIGAALYAAGLGADGIGPIAVTSSGAIPTLFFDGSGWFVSGTFMAATLFFGVGLISLVVHINKSQMVEGIWRSIIFISALIFVLVPAIPSGWGLYGVAIATYGVFAPIGLAIWRSA